MTPVKTRSDVCHLCVPPVFSEIKSTAPWHGQSQACGSGYRPARKVQTARARSTDEVPKSATLLRSVLAGLPLLLLLFCAVGRAASLDQLSVAR